MSRDIKFRAFITHLQILVKIESIDFITKMVEVDLTGGEGDTTWFTFENVELLQYTGLKDKNGKEIFEGDIVKYSFRDGNDINTRFMQIYNDGVNFKIKELHRDYWLEKVDGVLKIKHGHLTKYKGETNLLCDVSGLVVYWYEIIGNIYENPELLEGTA